MVREDPCEGRCFVRVCFNSPESGWGAFPHTPIEQRCHKSIPTFAQTPLKRYVSALFTTWVGLRLRCIFLRPPHSLWGHPRRPATAPNAQWRSDSCASRTPSLYPLLLCRNEGSTDGLRHTTRHRRVDGHPLGRLVHRESRRGEFGVDAPGRAPNEHGRPAGHDIRSRRNPGLSFGQERPALAASGAAGGGEADPMGARAGAETHRKRRRANIKDVGHPYRRGGDSRAPKK